MEFNKVKNKSYYEKLGFNDYKLWSKEDLSQFLIYDFFDTMHKMIWTKDITEKSFFDAQKHRIKKYNSYRLILNILDKFLLGLYLKRNFFMRTNQDRKNILFEGSKYPALILEAKKYHNVRFLVQGSEDRLFALSHFIGSLNINDLDSLIFCYLKEKNIKYLHELVEKIENKLKMLMPDYIVLCMDMLPLERAIVLAAKKMGIPTIVVQHGMLSPSSCMLDFNVADYILVWGEYFKDLCQKQCLRKSDDIYVMGYSYNIKKNKKISKKKYKVCYLGQDFERYNKDILPLKLETINQLSKICAKLGLDFIYRPHPRREDQKIIGDSLLGIQITPKGETLEQTFNKADIFIGFSSTALIEATMRSKVSIQLMNFPIETDNLEKMGICEKSFQSLDELEKQLTKISFGSDLRKFQIALNHYYIETKFNPGQRFLEILKKIDLIRF